MTDPVDIEAVVAECRAKYPDPRVELVSVETRVGAFVLRSPTAEEHRRFVNERSDEAMRAVSFRNYFTTLCVYPERVALANLLDRYQGVLTHDRVQNAVGWLTGQFDTLLGKSWPAP